MNDILKNIYTIIPVVLLLLLAVTLVITDILMERKDKHDKRR